MATALSTYPANSARTDVVRWTLDSQRLVGGPAGNLVGDAMGRARRARRIAQTAAYGGGFGIAGIGVLGVVGYGLIKAEALMARKAVGIIEEAAPEDDGVYGAAPGAPIELLVLGDSSAAGLGAEVGTADHRRHPRDGGLGLRRPSGAPHQPRRRRRRVR